jgi:deazaflavin-dependent oxidoreductase (nitroreductase family)
MATSYKLTLFQRGLNAWVKIWVRLGLPPRKYHLMTVPGRRSGRPRTVSVSVVEEGGERCLVCPYGERQWVKNVRAEGMVTLSRGLYRETLVATEEVDPDRKATVLKAYFRNEPITRKYFRAGADSQLAEFASESALHPVFRLSPVDCRL